MSRGEDPDDYPALKEPQLYQDLVWIWEAFMMLSGGRGSGMGGPLPISLQEILAYGKIYAIEGEELEDFAWIIRRMDSEWLNIFYKHQTKQNTGPKKK